MPHADSNGVRLYFEEAGRGAPIIFVHEFAGDLRSWEPQLRHFSRRYRCIAFNARGYPPSDVPKSRSQYSQVAAIEDIRSIMRHLRLAKAHIIGCSMGGYATLLFGLAYPRLAHSLTAIGAGSGSDPLQRKQFLAASAAAVDRYEEGGLAAALKPYMTQANRVQLMAKDPRAWAEFAAHFLEGSALGRAHTVRGVTMRRPSIYSLERGFARLAVPTHLIVGDEDEDPLGPNLFIKRVCAAARLTVVPSSGHVVNVEEPQIFNRITGDFLSLVDSGGWRPRGRPAARGATAKRQ
ncbi:MAG: alpha/beta fold hydrolase [Burkholderiales bacterium]